MSQTTFDPPAEELTVPQPKPTLWRLLVRPLEPAKKVGTIELTNKTQQDQEFVTVVGQVIDMGEQAFQKAALADSRNPTIGDWVLYPTYGGQRIELADGRVFVILNDDAVLAVVDNPEPYRKKIV